MSEHNTPTDPAEPEARIVKVPRGRRFWLERGPRRPEPEGEDQEPEVPTDE